MEQLGIEANLLIAQIVNFAIIVFVLSKLLYKPILGMLEKRRQEIADGLALTEKMRLEEEKLKERHQKLNEKARADARQIIEAARKDAKEEERRILSEAHDEATKIIEKAKDESKKQYDDMLKNIRHEAVDLAVAMTRRLTATVLSVKEQHRLIGEHIKELESVKI
jgi:F-type H+-transporting ATPase subunit b